MCGGGTTLAIVDCWLALPCVNANAAATAGSVGAAAPAAATAALLAIADFARVLCWTLTPVRSVVARKR